ncbi:hypothetical protein [Nocardiopsis sp. Huas11]|uniref:hypothetical protein n=1 Tax=Nocardiopsis sp. Huas11 TaxID=2183912 RepID=UPI0013152A2F|nr:hypothetical protein [Nocardiopsis sp. Huas11]
MEVASRMQAIEWSGKALLRKSQARLLQEYLRRSALWAQGLHAQGWPFFDIDHGVDLYVRVPAETADEALKALPDFATFYVGRTVEWSRDADLSRDEPTEREKEWRA